MALRRVVFSKDKKVEGFVLAGDLMDAGLAGGGFFWSAAGLVFCNLFYLVIEQFGLICSISE